MSDWFFSIVNCCLLLRLNYSSPKKYWRKPVQSRKRNSQNERCNLHLIDVPARQVRRDFVSVSKRGVHLSVDEAMLTSQTLTTPSDDAEAINLGDSTLKETRPFTRFLWASCMQNAFLPLFVSQEVTWWSSPPV